MGVARTETSEVISNSKLGGGVTKNSEIEIKGGYPFSSSVKLVELPEVTGKIFSFSFGGAVARIRTLAGEACSTLGVGVAKHSKVEVVSCKILVEPPEVVTCGMFSFSFGARTGTSI